MGLSPSVYFPAYQPSSRYAGNCRCFFPLVCSEIFRSIPPVICRRLRPVKGMNPDRPCHSESPKSPSLHPTSVATLMCHCRHRWKFRKDQRLASMPSLDETSSLRKKGLVSLESIYHGRLLFVRSIVLELAWAKWQAGMVARLARAPASGSKIFGKPTQAREAPGPRPIDGAVTSHPWTRSLPTKRNQFGLIDERGLCSCFSK